MSRKSASTKTSRKQAAPPKALRLKPEVPPVVNGEAGVQTKAQVSATLVDQPEEHAGYERGMDGLVIIPDGDEVIVRGWYARAAQVNDAGALLLLMQDLFTKYQHNYVSFIHSIAIVSGVAGAVMNTSKQGPCDDYQRQMVGFLLLRMWHQIPEDEPLKMFRFSDILENKPVSVKTFRVIDEYQGDWLRRKALTMLANTAPSKVHPDLRKHWQFLASGGTPDGFVKLSVPSINKE